MKAIEQMALKQSSKLGFSILSINGEREIFIKAGLF